MKYLRTLILSFGLFALSFFVSAEPVTPQWAETYLKEHKSPLLNGSETDHVMSYYFFGDHAGRTLIGLERVRGDDYIQHYSIMVFESGQLLGYYEDIPILPLTLNESGVLSFPRGFELSETVLIQLDEFPALCLGEYRPCIQWQPVIEQEPATIQ